MQQKLEGNITAHVISFMFLDFCMREKTNLTDFLLWFRMSVSNCLSNFLKIVNVSYRASMPLHHRVSDL